MQTKERPKNGKGHLMQRTVTMSPNGCVSVQELRNHLIAYKPSLSTYERTYVRPLSSFKESTLTMNNEKRIDEYFGKLQH